MIQIANALLIGIMQSKTLFNREWGKLANSGPSFPTQYLVDGFVSKTMWGEKEKERTVESRN